jgi:putative ATPase
MEPLASKLRPASLDHFVGQAHLVGPGQPLRVAVEGQHRFSFILWGPPGVGKTTLARIYAKALAARLYELSAVSAGKEDIRQIVAERDTLLESRPKVLFLDEIHRFNKAQQDFLLPYVESGVLTLIGATTENPSFEIISPLLSRCRVFTLAPLTPAELGAIIKRSGIKVDKKSLEWLAEMSHGDARIALTVLENAERLYGQVSVATLTNTLQSAFLRFDKKGEEHYDTISAFIKSLRAGDADAAIYYLARMLAGGEDPKFIARRMVVFASEDVGLAQSTALVVANEVFRAVEIIGLPEAAINLAHGAAYLALAAKDRSAYEALRAAETDVKKTGNLTIPLKIRNLPRLPGGKAGAPTKLMKGLGYGKGYDLSAQAGKYDKESYLPDKLKNKKYLKRPRPKKGPRAT